MARRLADIFARAFCRCRARVVLAHAKEPGTGSGEDRDVIQRH